MSVNKHSENDSLKKELYGGCLVAAITFAGSALSPVFMRNRSFTMHDVLTSMAIGLLSGLAYLLARALRW